MLNENRPCDSKNRKKDRYTRKDLENLVLMHHVPLSPVALKKMSMDELCKYLKEYPEKRKRKIAFMKKRKEQILQKKRKQDAIKKKYIERKKKRIQFQKENSDRHSRTDKVK